MFVDPGVTMTLTRWWQELPGRFHASGAGVLAMVLPVRPFETVARALFAGQSQGRPRRPWSVLGLEYLEDRAVPAAVPLTPSWVYTEDVIVNRANGVTDTTQSAVDRTGWAFITQAYADFLGGNAGPGLPDSGLIPATQFHPEFQLPYDNADGGNNARVLRSDTGSFTFDVPQDRYAFVHIAATSTEFTTQFRLILTYTTGSQETTAIRTIPDWFADLADSANEYNLLDGMDRAQAAGGNFENANTVAVRGFRFAADPNRVLASVTVEKTSTNSSFPSFLNFFGAYGVPAGLPVSTSADSADEGETFTLSGSLPAATHQEHTVTVTWDDGTSDTLVLAPGVTDFSLPHAYTGGLPATDPSEMTIAVEVASPDGNTRSATAVVTVHNVAPQLEIGGGTSVFQFDLFTRDASFADPGLSNFTVTADYGEGAGPEPVEYLPDHTFRLSHTYQSEGDYTVTVTVADGRNGTDQETFTVHVQPLPNSWTVDRLSDDAEDGDVSQGRGSLRFVLEKANQSLGEDLITFADNLSGTIGVIGGEYYIGDDVRIVNPNPGGIILDGSSNYARFFNINATATIRGLVMQNSDGAFQGEGGYSGGAILNQGDLTLIDCVIRNCSANEGGAIFNSYGMLTLSGCVIANNTAEWDGGGINSNAGHLQITNTTIRGNSAGSSGGGIKAGNTDVTITRSTVSNNQAMAGGGMSLASSSSYYDPYESGSLSLSSTGTSGEAGVTVTLTNTTISGNQAGQGAGAIAAYASYGGALDIELTFCTVAFNTSPGVGGIHIATDFGSVAVNFRNTLFAGNTNTLFFRSDGYGGTLEFNSLGHNLSDVGLPNPQGGDRTGDARLAPLGAYGGQTQTHALLPGSQAIGNGIAYAGSPQVDQRGRSRPPQGDPALSPDIGAYQTQGFTFIKENDLQRTDPGTTFSEPLRLRVLEGGQPVVGVPVTFTLPDSFAGGFAGEQGKSVTVQTDEEGWAVSPLIQAGPDITVVKPRAHIGGDTVNYTLNVGTQPLQLNVGDGQNEFVNQDVEFVRPGRIIGGAGATTVVTVNFGDGSGIQEVSYGEDGSFVLRHVYPREGTFPVFVSVVSGTERDTAQFDIDVLLPGVPTPIAKRTDVSPGSTGTASTAGVTATLVHNGDSNESAAIIVALVPDPVAAHLGEAFLLSQGLRVSAAYDVRAIRVTTSDYAVVQFTYYSPDGVIPILTYRDMAGNQVPVSSSLIVVDTVLHKLTIRLDSFSSPRLQEMWGTVFTISVPQFVPAGQVFTASAPNFVPAIPEQSRTRNVESSGTSPSSNVLSLASLLAGVLVGSAGTGVQGLGTAGGSEDPDQGPQPADNKGAARGEARVLEDLPQVPPGVINLQAVPITPGSAEPPVLDTPTVPTPLGTEETSQPVPEEAIPPEEREVDQDEGRSEERTSGLDPASEVIHTVAFAASPGEDAPEAAVILAALAVVVVQQERPRRRPREI